MAEDKIKTKKKTKELNGNIYALNLDFEDIETNEIDKVKKIEEEDEEEEKELVLLKGYDDFGENEDDIVEEPKKKKVLSKIEEGIKSSKRGRPRKTAEEKALAAAQRASSRTEVECS